MTRSLFLLLGSFAITACAGQTLDGGSGQGTSSGSSSGASSGTTGSTTGEGTIADSPLAGTIAGRAFEPKAIYVRYSNANAQWFFAIDNYENDCGSMKSRPDPTTALKVNIGAVDPKVGSSPLAYGDGHGATFQIGVYETAEQAETRPVQTGTLRFDTWSDSPGSTVSGALKLSGEESEVEGTFVAKVCPAR
jgi:hypothetical protein